MLRRNSRCGESVDEVQAKRVRRSFGHIESLRVGLIVGFLLFVLTAFPAMGQDTTAPGVTLGNPDTYYVDDVCQVTIPFTGYVTDDTCINAADITITRKCESGIATYTDWTVTKTQNGATRVDTSGSVTLSNICSSVG